MPHLVLQGDLPIQRAYQSVGLNRASYYRPVVNWAQHDAPIIEALTTLSETQPRWGFRKYVGRLRNAGHRWNHKRLPVRLRQPLEVLPQPNAVWAVDFMSDTLSMGADGLDLECAG